MDPAPKVKSKKDILAENLMEMIDRNPSSAALLLLTVVLLPWSVDFVSPSLKFLCHIWKGTAPKGTVDWMRQPILFLLMNLMILSIWMSSGAICRASAENAENGNNCNENRSSSLPSASTKQSKGSLVRSLSTFDKKPQKDSLADSLAPLLSSESQENDGSDSDPRRHCRSFSFPFREANKFFSTPFFSISTSKEDQSPSPHTQFISTTSPEQKLLHTAVNFHSFPVEHEANVSKINPPMRVEKIVDDGWIDARRFHWHNSSPEKRFEDKRINLTALIGQETSSCASDCSSSEKSSRGSDHLKTSVAASKTPSVVVDYETESSSPSDDADTSRTSLDKEKDELDERIKAFYARFREQLRQQRLQELKEYLQQQQLTGPKGSAECKLP